MTAMEEDIDDRFAGIDIDSLLNRSYERRPRSYGRKQCLYEAPEFLRRLNGEETVMEGQSLCLDCKVIGFPAPSLRWFKDDEEILDHPRIHVESDGKGGYSLFIKHVNKGDEAAYRCRAENVEGASSCFFFLSVRGKPKNKKKRDKNSSKKRSVSFPPMFSTIVEKVEEEDKQGKAQETEPPSPLTEFYYALTLKGRQTWPSFLGDWAYTYVPVDGDDDDDVSLPNGHASDEVSEGLSGRALMRRNQRRRELNARSAAKRRRRQEEEDQEDRDKEKQKSEEELLKEQDEERERKEREEKENERRRRQEAMRQRRLRREQKAQEEHEAKVKQMEEESKEKERLEEEERARKEREDEERKERERLEEEERVRKERKEEERLCKLREEEERLWKEKEEERLRKEKEEQETLMKKREEERLIKEREEATRSEDQRRKKEEEKRRHEEEEKRRKEELRRMEEEKRQEEERERQEERRKEEIERIEKEKREEERRRDILEKEKRKEEDKKAEERRREEERKEKLMLQEEENRKEEERKKEEKAREEERRKREVEERRLREEAKRKEAEDKRKEDERLEKEKEKKRLEEGRKRNEERRKQLLQKVAASDTSASVDSSKAKQPTGQKNVLNKFAKFLDEGQLKAQDQRAKPSASLPLHRKGLAGVSATADKFQPKLADSHSGEESNRTSLQRRLGDTDNKDKHERGSVPSTKYSMTPATVSDKHERGSTRDSMTPATVSDKHDQDIPPTKPTSALETSGQSAKLAEERRRREEEKERQLKAKQKETEEKERRVRELKQKEEEEKRRKEQLKQEELKEKQKVDEEKRRIEKLKEEMNLKEKKQREEEERKRQEKLKDEELRARQRDEEERKLKEQKRKEEEEKRKREKLKEEELQARQKEQEERKLKEQKEREDEERRRQERLKEEQMKAKRREQEEIRLKALKQKEEEEEKKRQEMMMEEQLKKEEELKQKMKARLREQEEMRLAEEKQKEREELRLKQQKQKEELKLKMEQEVLRLKEERERAQKEERLRQFKKEKIRQEQLKRQYEEEMRRKKEREEESRRRNEQKAQEAEEKRLEIARRAELEKELFEVKIYKRDYSFGDLRKSLETHGGGEVLDAEEHKYWDEILEKHNYSISDLKSVFDFSSKSTISQGRQERQPRSRVRRNSIDGDASLERMKRSGSLSDIRDAFTKSLDRPKKDKSEKKKSKRTEDEFMKRTSSISDLKQVFSSAASQPDSTSSSKSSLAPKAADKSSEPLPSTSATASPKLRQKQKEGPSSHPELTKLSVSVAAKRASFHEMLSQVQQRNAQDVSLMKERVRKRASVHGFDSYGSREIPVYKRLSSWSDDVDWTKGKGGPAATPFSPPSSRSSSRPMSPCEDLSGGQDDDRSTSSSRVRPFVYNSIRTIARISLDSSDDDDDDAVFENDDDSEAKIPTTDLDDEPEVASPIDETSDHRNDNGVQSEAGEEPKRNKPEEESEVDKAGNATTPTANEIHQTTRICLHDPTIQDGGQNEPQPSSGLASPGIFLEYDDDDDNDDEKRGDGPHSSPFVFQREEREPTPFFKPIQGATANDQSPPNAPFERELTPFFDQKRSPRPQFSEETSSSESSPDREVASLGKPRSDFLTVPSKTPFTFEGSVRAPRDSTPTPFLSADASLQDNPSNDKALGGLRPPRESTPFFPKEEDEDQPTMATTDDLMDPVEKCSQKQHAIRNAHEQNASLVARKDKLKDSSSIKSHVDNSLQQPTTHKETLSVKDGETLLIPPTTISCGRDTTPKDAVSISKASLSVDSQTLTLPGQSTRYTTIGQVNKLTNSAHNISTLPDSKTPKMQRAISETDTGLGIKVESVSTTTTPNVKDPLNKLTIDANRSTKISTPAPTTPRAKTPEVAGNQTPGTSEMPDSSLTDRKAAAAEARKELFRKRKLKVTIGGKIENENVGVSSELNIDKQITPPSTEHSAMKGSVASTPAASQRSHPDTLSTSQSTMPFKSELNTQTSVRSHHHSQTAKPVNAMQELSRKTESASTNNCQSGPQLTQVEPPKAKSQSSCQNQKSPELAKISPLPFPITTLPNIDTPKAHIGMTKNDTSKNNTPKAGITKADILNNAPANTGVTETTMLKNNTSKSDALNKETSENYTLKGDASNKGTQINDKPKRAKPKTDTPPRRTPDDNKSKNETQTGIKPKASIGTLPSTTEQTTTPVSTSSDSMTSVYTSGRREFTAIPLSRTTQSSTDPNTTAAPQSSIPKRGETIPSSPLSSASVKSSKTSIPIPKATTTEHLRSNDVKTAQDAKGTAHLSLPQKAATTTRTTTTTTTTSTTTAVTSNASLSSHSRSVSPRNGRMVPLHKETSSTRTESSGRSQSLVAKTTTGGTIHLSHDSPGKDSVLKITNNGECKSAKSLVVLKISEKTRTGQEILTTRSQIPKTPGKDINIGEGVSKERSALDSNSVVKRVDQSTHKLTPTADEASCVSPIVNPAPRSALSSLRNALPMSHRLVDSSKSGKYSVPKRLKSDSGKDRLDHVVHEASLWSRFSKAFFNAFLVESDPPTLPKEESKKPARRFKRNKSSDSVTSRSKSKGRPCRLKPEDWTELSPFGRYTPEGCLVLCVMTFVALMTDLRVEVFICYILAAYYMFFVLRLFKVLE